MKAGFTSGVSLAGFTSVVGVGVVIRNAELYDLVENQTDGGDSAYDSVAYDLVKTRLSKLQAERKHSEGVRTSTVEHCDWFVLPLLFATTVI